MPITTTELQATIGLDDSQFQRGVSRTKQGLGEVTQEANKTTKAFDDLKNKGSEISAMGSTLTMGISVPIVALGVAAVGTAARFDQLHRGMVAVTGSMQGANKEFERLKEVAKLPGLGFEEAIRGSTRLQAAGLSADQARNSLMAFGNAIATVGGGKAQLDGVILALGQISAKGKVSAEEINQIAERVPQIRQIMIKEFGTADTEVIQKAGLSSEEFISRVTKQLLLIPKVTGGIANDFENLGDTVNQSLAKIGEALIPATSAFVNHLAPAIAGVANAFRGLPPGVQNAVLTFAVVAAAIGPVLLVLGQLAIATTRIRDGWNALRELGPGIRALFYTQAESVTKATLATTANTDANAVNVKAVADDSTAVGLNAKAATDASAARSSWNTTTNTNTGYLDLNTKAVVTNTGAEEKNAIAAGEAALARNGGLAVGLSPAVAAARAKAAGGGGGGGIAIGPGVGLTAALLINQAKQFLPDNDTNVGQHGLTGFLADIGSGAAGGAGLGAMAGAPFAGVGAVPGAIVGGVGGALFGAWRHISGEGDRQKAIREAQEKETAANVQAEHEKHQAARPAGSLPVDPAKKLEEAQKLADAQYDAQLTGIKAGLEGKDSDTAKSREAAATIPLLQERLAYIRKQAADEKTANGLTVEYYRWQKEFFSTQQSIIGLRSGAQDETKNALAKQKDQQRAVDDSRYAAFNQYVQTRVTDAEPDQRARVEREEMAPVLTRRQQELIQRARALLPQTAGNLENQKEYFGLVKQYWSLEEQMGQMDAKATAEEKTEAKKAADTRKKEIAARFAFQDEVIKAQIASLPEQQRAMAELTMAVPILQRQQMELAQEARSMKPGTEEYWKNLKEQWSIQKDINENASRQQKEVQKQQQDAKTALASAAHEKLEITNLETQILEEKLKHDPFLTDKQRQAAVLPLLYGKFRQLLHTIPGESRTDSLRRELEATQVEGNLMEHAGVRADMFRRTLGGGRMFLGDPRQVARMTQAIRQAHTEAARDNARILAQNTGPKDGVSVYNIILHGRTPEERKAEALHALEQAERQHNPW